jgi:uncharacterized cupredoxin-like copper-binding protein
MQQKHPYLRLLIAVLVIGLVTAACSSAETVTTAAETETTMDPDMEMHEEEDGDHAEAYEFGIPMEASDADRVIEITAGDDFTFGPSSVTVAEGETVTFRVTNVGVIPHDFTLGDVHLQDEHEAEMAEMADSDMAMHDEANVFVLEPGETKEMTWQMTSAGEILFGCHQPGHYAAGMVGTIDISG